MFHAVYDFNNGGLALYPDSLTRYVGDPVVCLTVSFAVIIAVTLVTLAAPSAVEWWQRERRRTLDRAGIPEPDLVAVGD